MFHFSTLCLLASLSFRLVTAGLVQVHDTATLQTALKTVSPGEVIQLADGSYHGVFVANITGTAGQPILLSGSRQAMLSSPSYALHLSGVSHWILRGFTLHASMKGLVLDNSSFNTIEHIEVFNIEDEGVHFRKDSSDNVLESSYIHNTGLKRPGFGEAVYIGSAYEHWENNTVDHSDRNQILNNRLGPNVTAEEIDIKEGTCCGTILNNTFDGTGMSGENSADSWIDLKGDQYNVEGNSGAHSLKDGIQVHHQTKTMAALKADGHGLLGGCHNIIRHDKCTDIKGKCVAVEIKDSKVLVANDCTNTVDSSA